MKKIIQQSGNYELDENEEENLENMIQNLPDPVQEKFKKNNINIKEVLNIIRNKKSKRSSINKQRIKKDEQNKPDRTDLWRFLIRIILLTFVCLHQFLMQKP